MYHTIAKRSRRTRIAILLRRIALRLPRRVIRLVCAAVACCIVVVFALFLRRRNAFRHALGGLRPSQDGLYFDKRGAPLAKSLWHSEALRDREHEAWTKVKYDVVVAVKTGHEVAQKRLKALREKGWWRVGRHVPNFLVVSDADDESVGAIGLKKYALDLVGMGSGKTAPAHWFDKSGWRGDKDKNLPAVHLMRTLYPGKKWYVLLDDDTYMFLDNFAKYIGSAEMNDSRAIYTGKVFYISRCGGFERDGSWAKNHSEPKGVFAHGGSGIVMNGLAVESMYKGIPKCIREFSSCWAGDMQISLCLRKHGVLMMKRNRNTNGKHGISGTSVYEKHFTPFSASKSMSDKRYSKHWKSLELPLTFHKMGETEMGVMSEFEVLAAATNTSVHYSGLRKHLLSNGILPDHSAHARESKQFSAEFLPQHLKR
ncbi:unnamed protein product [Agarophyton chilense]